MSAAGSGFIEPVGEGGGEMRRGLAGGQHLVEPRIVRM